MSGTEGTVKPLSAGQRAHHHLGEPPPAPNPRCLPGLAELIVAGLASYDAVCGYLLSALSHNSEPREFNDRADKWMAQLDRAIAEAEAERQVLETVGYLSVIRAPGAFIAAAAQHANSHHGNILTRPRIQALIAAAAANGRRRANGRNAAG